MKKLIPALCMLLIAAAMLGTSTYAWFSMNTTVTATGMQVKAKSDAKFLQIAESATGWNDTDPFTSVTISAASKALYPTHAFKAIAADRKTATAFDGTDLVWASTYSTDPAQAKEGVGEDNLYTDVTSSVTTDYALLTTFKVRLKPGVGVTTASNLKVASVSFEAVVQDGTDITDGLANSLRVLFVCGENKVVWKNGAFVEGTADSLLAASVTNSDTTVNAYVYFDGEDDSCITNNAVTPDDYKLSFTLSVS